MCSGKHPKPHGIPGPEDKGRDPERSARPSDPETHGGGVPGAGGACRLQRDAVVSTRRNSFRTRGSAHAPLGRRGGPCGVRAPFSRAAIVPWSPRFGRRAPAPPPRSLFTRGEWGRPRGRRRRPLTRPTSGKGWPFSGGTPLLPGLSRAGVSPSALHKVGFRRDQVSGPTRSWCLPRKCPATRTLSPRVDAPRRGLRPPAPLPFTENPHVVSVGPGRVRT